MRRMLQIASIFALAAISTNSNGQERAISGDDYVAVTSTKDSTHYVKRKYLGNGTGVFKQWVMYIWNNNSEMLRRDGVQKSMGLHYIDCDKRKFGVIRSVHYSERGELIHDTGELYPIRVSDPVPESAAWDLLESICVSRGR